MREQGQLYIEEGAFADAAYDCGHTVSGIDVAARLGAILLFKNDDGIAQSGWQRGQLGADLELAQGLADLLQRRNFL